MDIKQVLDYYVEQSSRSHSNTWEAIEALFPNLDIDFSIHDPKERELIIAGSKFIKTLPKGSEVTIDTVTKLDNYDGYIIEIYVPENENQQLWIQKALLENTQVCHFKIVDKRQLDF